MNRNIGIGMIALAAMFAASAPRAIAAYGMTMTLVMAIVLGGVLAVGVYVWTQIICEGMIQTKDPEPLNSEPAPIESKPTFTKNKITEPPVITPPTLVCEESQPIAVAKPRITPAELLEQIHHLDWFQFEKLMDLLFRNEGYRVERRGGANPDGGIDLVLESGNERWAVQCKHWKVFKVKVGQIREFIGALKDAQIERGIYITLRGYTADACQLAAKHQIQTLGEADLARMLKSANAAEDPIILALLNDQRKFCPKCERKMILRTASKGPGAGKRFWGCSGYPKCHYTMSYNETQARPLNRRSKGLTDYLLRSISSPW